MKYPFYFVSILILVFYTPNIAVGGGSYLAEYTPPGSSVSVRCGR